jgi:UDP-N-acetylmuramate: L-alanyl-gamma-D-glutamyl-meso-diaminopimelate ligase
LEGDEYDTAFFDKGPKFVHYQPEQVLLTSIEFDHADIYQNLEQILESFRKLIKIIPSEGGLVANLDDPRVRSMLKEYSGKLITYAMEPENHNQADYFGEV